MSTRVHHRLLGLRSGCKSIGGKANTFVGDNDRVLYWRRTRLSLETKAFSGGNEAYIALETNAFSVKYCPWNIVLVQLKYYYRCSNVLTAI